MLFSHASEYAVRGLAELAGRAKHNQPLRLDEILSGTGLPRDYLAKLFRRLVKGGILRSAKGRGGGFSCSRAPQEITLMQIIEAMQGPQCFERCISGLDKCSNRMPCAQHHRYNAVRRALTEYLNTTTLADLAAASNTSNNPQGLYRV